MKKNNQKLLDTFINKKLKCGLYSGVTPKKPIIGDLYTNRLNELYYYNGKCWEKVV